ncbi:hypothetical protein HDV03_001643 [Kappamyces sp. JEL0829]|nr:hypothetical protein HDV03_001643 [Kappamyces sp. JEL0829]
MGQSVNASALRLLWKHRANLRRLLAPTLVVRGRPARACVDVRDVDYAALKHEMGIQAIVFDKDNTLTEPYKDHLHPPFADAWKTCLETFGAANMAIVSNSAGSKDDPGFVQAQQIERSLGVPVLRSSEKVRS